MTLSEIDLTDFGKEPGQRIQDLRKDKFHWSQEEFAYRLDCTRQIVSKFETGKAISPYMFLKVVELLQTTPDYILYGKESLDEGKEFYTEWYNRLSVTEMKKLYDCYAIFAV